MLLDVCTEQAPKWIFQQLNSDTKGLNCATHTLAYYEGWCPFSFQVTL
jgi:hypothetical protein